MNFEGKIVSVMCHAQHLAEKDECMDNFCKQRAECLCCFFAHTSRAWSVAGIFHMKVLRKLVKQSRVYGYFQILDILGKTEHAQTMCTRLFFSPPPCTRPKNEVITHAAHEGYIQFEMVAKSFILAAKVLQPKKEKVVSNFVISAAHLSSLVEYTGREN